MSASHAVILCFDQGARDALMRMRRLLEDSGIRTDYGAEPHLTLMIFRDMDIEVLKRGIDRFASMSPQVVLPLHSLGVFPGEGRVLYVAPKATFALLSLHDLFMRQFEGYERHMDAHYLSESWAPHATLSLHLDAEQLSRAMGLLGGTRELPVRACIERIGILEFPPNQLIHETRIGDCNCQ